MPQAEATKQASDAASTVSPPKVDYATDLFNILSMDGPSENGSGAISPDDNAWAGFQCMSLLATLFTYWIIKEVLLVYPFFL